MLSFYPRATFVSSEQQGHPLPHQSAHLGEARLYPVPEAGICALGTSMIALPIASSHLQASQLQKVHDASGPTSELRETWRQCPLFSCTEVWPQSTSGQHHLGSLPAGGPGGNMPHVSERNTPKSLPCQQM